MYELFFIGIIIHDYYYYWYDDLIVARNEVE